MTVSCLERTARRRHGSCPSTLPLAKRMLCGVCMRALHMDAAIQSSLQKLTPSTPSTVHVCTAPLNKCMLPCNVCVCSLVVSALKQVPAPTSKGGHKCCITSIMKHMDELSEKDLAHNCRCTALNGTYSWRLGACAMMRMPTNRWSSHQQLSSAGAFCGRQALYLPMLCHNVASVKSSLLCALRSRSQHLTSCIYGMPVAEQSRFRCLMHARAWPVCVVSMLSAGISQHRPQARGTRCDGCSWPWSHCSASAKQPCQGSQLSSTMMHMHLLAGARSFIPAQD